MEINTHNRIEFRLELEESTYSFFIPHGSSIQHAINAASAFLNGLVKLEKDHVENNAEKGEEKDKK